MSKALHQAGLASILALTPIAVNAAHIQEPFSLSATAASYWNAFNQKPEFVFGLEGTYHVAEYVSLAGQFHTAFTRGDLNAQLRLYPMAPHPLGLYFTLGPHVLYAVTSSGQTNVSVAGGLGLGTEFLLPSGWQAAGEVGGVLPFSNINLTELVLQVRFGKRF